jgi:acyl-CoA thioesterase YciA
MADTFLPQNQHLAIRTVAMPRDANAAGDIFGGWVVSQMDLAAGTVAVTRIGSRAVTIAIQDLVFHKPIFIGDEVSCYAEIIKIGKTSITIKVETWTRRRPTSTSDTTKVVEGTFTFVSIDENYAPKTIQKTF